MDWITLYQSTKKDLQKSSSQYRTIAYALLVLGILFTFLLFPFGIAILLLSGILFYYANQTSKKSAHVLTGLVRKKEILEYELPASEGEENQNWKPTYLYSYYIDFSILKSFYLGPNGIGELKIQPSNEWKDFQISKQVYSYCEKNKEISFVIGPDNSMLGFGIDGSYTKLPLPMPIESSKRRKAKNALKLNKISESIEF